MYQGYYGYSLATPKDPAKLLKELRIKNPDICPIVIQGTKIAKTWWGISWNKNLERYADYESRIGRGRSYIRKGMVLDLQISPGSVTALVAGSGSQPYRVRIGIAPLCEELRDSITAKCKNRIDSLQELIDGTFPEELSDLFFSRTGGLFPTPREISLSCSCPDWATMCKHVAATLYGVGTRLDNDPLLFFTLRGIDFQMFLKKSADEKVKSLLANAGKITSRTLPANEIATVFGEVL